MDTYCVVVRKVLQTKIIVLGKLKNVDYRFYQIAVFVTRKKSMSLKF